MHVALLQQHHQDKTAMKVDGICPFDQPMSRNDVRQALMPLSVSSIQYSLILVKGSDILHLISL